jgi:serine/threonine-protein kinase
VPATTLSTAADALHGEEIDRTRAFVRLGLVAALAAAAATLALPGDSTIRIALLAALAVGALGGVWVERAIADPTRYRASTMMIVALVAIAAGQLSILYCGVTSAAPLLVALGLYFFCRTESLPLAIAVYALAATMHAIEAILVISGVVDDPGFAPVNPRVSALAHLSGQALLQGMYLTCFFLARLTRRSSLKSIEQLQKATRLAAQRDVQLAELRQDLDRALKVGGPGRFTGQLVGDWTLGNVLGRGAMGEVYEAKSSDASDGAVKLLRRELLSDPAHVERFLREVRVASALESPNVVRVLQASTPEDPIPFLAMERLRGGTLGELVRHGPVTGPQLRTMVEQIGGVLELARAAGIVHRDLKPHNIFLADGGTWKVLDFGVALLADSTGTLTQGAVIGTPTYMAPEQARGEVADHRADVYALGAVIYRCITGRVPYLAKDTPALLYSVVHTMPARPSEISAATPHEEAFLAIALAKDKSDRFATAAELVAAFADAERGALAAPLLKRARDVERRHPWASPEAAARS